VERFGRSALPDLTHPYLGVSGALTPSVQVAMEGVGSGFARGSGTWTPSQHFRLRAAHTFFDTGVERPILHSSQRRSTTEADLFVRPLPSHQRWFVQASLVRQAMANGDLSTWQATTSYQFNALRAEGGVRRESSWRPGGARSSRDFQRIALTGFLPLVSGRRTWVQAEVETLDASSLHRVRARAAYQVTQDARLEGGWGWSRVMGHTLTVSITQVFVPEGGRARVTQLTQGTVQWNEATGGLAFGNIPGLARGGVSGYVFLDENGNGDMDPGEPVLDGVRVVMGGQTVRTDSQGRFRAWDLVPFEPLRLRVDPQSIPDPTWISLRGVVEVEVPPASYRRVDLPLSPSGEVTGRAVRVNGEGKELPLANLELELVDQERGSVRTLSTFSDGEFYLFGVPPGSYHLRVAGGALRGTGLVPEKDWMAVSMPREAARMFVSGLVIRLVPEG
jgi:hypothetical protein